MSYAAATSESRNKQLLTVAVAVVFAASAVLFRLTPHPENFACFGALAFFCGLKLSGMLRWVLPLVSMFFADSLGHFMGSSAIHFYYSPSMVLNYVAFAAMIGVGSLLSSSLETIRHHEIRKVLLVVSGTVVASFIFFIVSNFGAWLDPMLGYDRTLAGLLRSYQMGLPFWRSTLSSDIVFSLAFYVIYNVIAKAFLPRLAEVRR